MKNGISLPRALTAVVLGVTIVLLFTLQLGWREWWQISLGIVAGIIVGMFVANHRRAVTVLKNIAVWSKDRAIEIPEAVPALKKVVVNSRKAEIEEIGAVFNALWTFLLIQVLFLFFTLVWPAKEAHVFSWILISIVVPLLVGAWVKEGIDNVGFYRKVGLFEAMFYGPWRLIKCLAAVIASIGIVLFKIVVIIFFLPTIFFKEINEQRLMRIVAAIAVGGLAGTLLRSWSWGLVGPVFYLLSPVIEWVFGFIYDLIDFKFTDTWESVWEFGKLTND